MLLQVHTALLGMVALVCLGVMAMSGQRLPDILTTPKRGFMTYMCV